MTADITAREALELLSREIGALYDRGHDFYGAAKAKRTLSAALDQLEAERKTCGEYLDINVRLIKDAHAAQTLVHDCSEYLKPGETPLERIERDQKDVLALIGLLETEKRASEALRKERDELKAALEQIELTAHLGIAHGIARSALRQSTKGGGDAG